MTLKQRRYARFGCIKDKKYLTWAYRMTGLRDYGEFSVTAADKFWEA